MKAVASRITKALPVGCEISVSDNSGAKVIKIFNRAMRNLRKFRVRNEDYLDTYLQVVWAYSLFFPFVELVGALALGMFIWRGGNLVILGVTSIGTLVAFMQFFEIGPDSAPDVVVFRYRGAELGQ